MIAPKVLRAATYIRMSSDAQDDSPTQQKARLTALAKQRGGRIVKAYQDSGISGLSTKKRPDFLKMLDDAERGEFDVLLCWDIDRLTREDSLAAGQWAGRLQRAGVRIEAVVQGPIDLDTFVGRFQFNMHAEMANQYVEKLSQVVSRAKLERAKRGILGPARLYGFDRIMLDEQGRERERVAYGVEFGKPKTWTSRRVVAADPTGPKIIREIFDRFVNQDIGAYGIALDLNDRGLLRPGGKVWRETMVVSVLRNPAYSGVLAYGRHPSGKLYRVDSAGEIQSSRGKGGCWPPQTPCVVIEDAHEAIVTRELFVAAQAKLADMQARKRRPRANSPFALAGVVFCGETGTRLVGQTCRHNGPNKREFRYYRRRVDSAFRWRGQLRTVRAEQLEAFIVDLLTSAVLSDAAFAQLRKRVATVAKARRTKAPTGAADLRKRIAALDAKITDGTDRLFDIDRASLSDFQAKLAAMRKERDALQAEADAGQPANPAETSAVVEKAIQAMKNLRRHLRSSDAAAVRGVVHSFVRRVELFWGEDSGRSHGDTRAMRFPLDRGIVELSCLPASFNLIPESTGEGQG